MGPVQKNQTTSQGAAALLLASHQRLGSCPITAPMAGFISELLAGLCVRIFLVRWMQAIKRWRQPDGASSVIPYTLIRIRIPTDDYRLVVDPVKDLL